jgi:PilZ domain
MPDFLNKRRFPRIPSQHALLVRRLADESSEALARTETMGGGGCMFVHEGPLGIGSHVELLISVRGTVVKAGGHVAWESARDDGRYEIGVAFSEVSEQDQGIIEALLREQPDPTP